MPSLLNKRRARSRVVGGPHKATQVAWVVTRAARLRIACQGYPIDRSFETREEVDAYFRQDRLDCLLCGRRFKWISPRHLGCVHNMSTDEYKVKFGLPLSRSLMCEESRAEKAEVMSSDLKEPDGKLRGDVSLGPKGHASHWRPPYYRAELAERIKVIRHRKKRTTVVTGDRRRRSSYHLTAEKVIIGAMRRGIVEYGELKAFVNGAGFRTKYFSNTLTTMLRRGIIEETR